MDTFSNQTGNQEVQICKNPTYHLLKFHGFNMQIICTKYKMYGCVQLE